MSTLYVAEYATVAPAQVSGSLAQAPHEPPITEQTVAISASAASSSAFNKQTAVVRIHTDSICSILFSVGGTAATTSNQRFVAGQTEYKSVPKGQGYSVSVIANT